MGDTFAYRISASSLEKLGIEDEYFLLRKVDELGFGDGSLLPVVTVTLWDKHLLPTDCTEFQTKPILKLSNGRLNLNRSHFEYRAEVLFRSEKQLAALGLVYLGKFEHFDMPLDEVIVRDPGEMLMLLPEHLEKICCGFLNCHRFCEMN